MEDIILILSDQHGSWATQNRLDYLDTENLTRLCEQGIEFEHCKTNSPLCVPSRMSFLSGQYPSELTLLDNDTTLPIDQPTLAHAMSLVGYHTVLIGRMHFKGDDQKHGFDERLVGDITSQYWGTGGRNRQDFGAYVQTTNRKHCLNVIGGGTSPVHAYDEAVLHAALEYLQQPHQQPQFIVIGFYGPHFPFVAKEELYNKYKERVVLPKDEQADAIYRSLLQSSTLQQRQHATAAYLGMVEQLDGYIGKIWEAVKNRKGTPTLIYTSDHGEQCGHRGIYGKQTFYEEASEVPLVIWRKGIQPKKVNYEVSLLDLSKEILNYAQTDLPYHQGVGFHKEHPVVAQQWLEEEKTLIECVWYRGYKLEKLGDHCVLTFHGNRIENEQCPVYEEMKSYFIDEQQHRELQMKMERQKVNHQFLSKWGKQNHPHEWATFVNPSWAREKPKE